MKEVSFQGLSNLSGPPVQQKQTFAKPDHSFSEIVKQSIEKVNELQKESDSAIHDLLVTKKKDIHETMIAMEKADVSFQLLMKVRNKIVASYEEIMRMNI